MKLFFKVFSCVRNRCKSWTSLNTTATTSDIDPRIVTSINMCGQESHSVAAHFPRRAVITLKSYSAHHWVSLCEHNTGSLSLTLSLCFLHGSRINECCSELASLCKVATDRACSPQRLAPLHAAPNTQTRSQGSPCKGEQTYDAQ